MVNAAFLAVLHCRHPIVIIKLQICAAAAAAATYS